MPAMACRDENRRKKRRRVNPAGAEGRRYSLELKVKSGVT